MWPFVVVIGIVAAGTGVLFFSLLRRYLSKRTSLVRSLCLTILCWFVGTTGYLVGLVEWYVDDDRGFLFRASLPLGYASIVVSTFFVLVFATEFLEVASKPRRAVLGTYGAFTVGLVASLFNFPGNQWGNLPPIPDYRLVNLVLLILGNLVVYAVLVAKFRDLTRRVEQPTYRASIRCLYGFFLLILLTFVFMVASEVHLMLVENPPPYGPLEYVAWLLSLAGMVFGYIGVMQPRWFMERVEHKSRDNEAKKKA